MTMLITIVVTSSRAATALSGFSMTVFGLCVSDHVLKHTAIGRRRRKLPLRGTRKMCLFYLVSPRHWFVRASEFIPWHPAAWAQAATLESQLSAERRAFDPGFAPGPAPCRQCRQRTSPAGKMQRQPEMRESLGRTATDKIQVCETQNAAEGERR